MPVVFRVAVCLSLCGAAAWADSAAMDRFKAEHNFIARQILEFNTHPEAQARLRAEAAHPAALIEPGDVDPLAVVLRRAGALLADLQSMPGAPALDREARELAALKEKAENAAPGTPARMDLFLEACALRRRVAFSNPLLDFNRLVFIKRHRARFEHMVDQHYGFHATPGGGVFVLENPFSEKPVLRNLLENKTVASGAMAGKRLDGGAVLSPDLDYDAQTLLFAWTEAEVPVPPTDLTPMAELWTEGSTYHIFSLDLSGGELRQLTSGPWNEFDPCFLPNGRVCFVSERRGGFLRCGLRPNPVHTLYSMRRDGSDIIRLSHHETHEWQPSVDNHGMLAYTRWDYVDRDSDIAHHLWLSFPDGRDPRSPHGNYPEVRESRPWMEMSIRAVPGSSKYVAASTPHHGQHFGSLVLIDPLLEDDNAMSQLRRVTPDTAFPESESAPGVPCPTHKGKNHGNAEIYGTPWPLNENYFLCAFDPGQKNYALCLVDVFGNREVLYRDPEIGCEDPIPLRPRPAPPVIPSKTRQAAEDRERPGDDTARLAVMNIYDSRLGWPEGTKITALRIIQLFPKTTPGAEDPLIGIGAQSLARGVLGTVPVEADGSVYCEAPAGVPLYFQALDEKGRAVQSMRTDTCLHPGETLSCRGCHESRHSAPDALSKVTPLAMRRPASVIQPGAEGSYPLSFPRLVQPVLERNCLPCHRKEEKAPSLEAATSGKWGWSESYQTLAPLAWAKHGGNGALRINGTSRSIPGEVGATASKLAQMLDAGHHDVVLSDGDRRRLDLWLDCNSVFYHAYHDMELQAAGQIVQPVLE